MKITEENALTINLTHAYKSGLPLSAYIYIGMLINCGVKIADKYAPISDTLSTALVKEGYLQIINASLAPTKKALDIFIINQDDFDKYFEELYNNFPRKVVSNSGQIRVLRADKLDSQDAKKCRMKYFKVLSEGNVDHQEVMKGLFNEMRTRGTNNLFYMNNLETWINQRVWEKYQDVGDIPVLEKFKRL